MKFISKYLREESFKWLNENSFYYELLIAKLHALNVLPIAEKLTNLDDIVRHRLSALLSKKSYTYFDTPEIGIMWLFASMIELGYTVYDNYVYSLCKDIIKFQMDDGGFSLNWDPYISTSCITGQIVYNLLMSRYEGKEVEKSLLWIVERQRDDGGWLHCAIGGIFDSMKYVLFRKSGKGLRYENTYMMSCPVATVLCTRALLQSKNNYTPLLQKAFDFMFNENRLFFEKGCKCRRGYDHTLLGCSYYLDYDPTDILTITHSYKENHPLYIFLFNLCLRKQLTDGRFPLEHNRKGGIHSFFQFPVHRQCADPLVTIKVLSMLYSTKNAIIEI